MNRQEMVNGTLEKNTDQDDSFDIFLRTQFQQEKPYLHDENFTAQVMARLPAPKKLLRWQERLIIAVPLLVISILVLSQNSLLASVIKVWVMLSVISVQNLFQLVLEVSLVALLVVSYWLANKGRLL